MAYLNENYLKLQAGYLFPEIARRVKDFCEQNPDAAKKLIRCGIGDVTEPLPRAAIDAMKRAVDERESARRRGDVEEYLRRRHAAVLLVRERGEVGRHGVVFGIEREVEARQMLRDGTERSSIHRAELGETVARRWHAARRERHRLSIRSRRRSSGRRRRRGCGRRRARTGQEQ